ncbi:FecCD family ABC transporter permease [Actinoplanes aureus]|uniref:FecCD family ABC transporter permease n=1 Tax=Actinoplanes aureus TaxID=2792083 RepID=UPI00281611B2|nr:iron ABC transporter permease [Actinoplanes aureus]
MSRTTPVAPGRPAPTTPPGHARERRRTAVIPTTALVVVLLAALVLAILTAVAVGTVAMPLGVVWQVISAHLTGGPVGVDPLSDQIIWQYRTPRVLLAALAGAGLAVAGVCLQALVRNPLADPYVLGISSGASLGAVLVLSYGSAALGGLGVAGAAFLTALLTLAAVFLLAQRGSRLGATRLVLAGIATTYLTTAATSYVQLHASPNELRGIMFWLLGSVSGATWPALRIPAVVVVVTLAWLILRARSLNALTTGDDSAATLGIPVNRLRVELLAVSALLTAAVVAVAGGVGFIGLMIPHMVRLIVGPDHRRALPVAAVGGALFLVLVDLGTRTVDPPNEYPLGVFTAALGAPFFLWLLRRNKNEVI